VRRICADCKEKYEPSKEELEDVNAQGKNIVFYRGKGCPKCLNTGYKGRISIYELMLPDEKIHDAVVAKASADEIRHLAHAAGMVALMGDGMEKVENGITSVEEVLRVTREE
jgi:type II secretory ATPase GspE/PulE/Tfp pilus assembly ATPase PilB-like protein